MLCRDSRRRLRAKLQVDLAIHNAIADLGGDRDARQAFLELLSQVQRYTDWLRIRGVGGRAGWFQAKRLIDGLSALSQYHADWIRSVATWESCEAGVFRQFGSLARHLLADHPVPNFMVLVWFAGNDQKARQHQKWFKHLARGHNIRGADLPLRLTKKMTAYFLRAPDSLEVEAALRWGQVRGLGGSRPLANAVLKTHLRSHFEHHAYWADVLRALVENPQVEIENVAPLIDYLRFSKEVLRVRSPLDWRRQHLHALLARVRKWRVESRLRSTTPAISWASSGIEEFDYHDRSRGWNSCHWKIRELLNSNQLKEEGWALHHCVGTYAGLCRGGYSSIWSLTCCDHLSQARRELTIEVDLEDRSIVEARGCRNARPTSAARDMMTRWADQAGLKIQSWV